MTAQEQLIKMVGKEDAEKYIQIVKNIMQHEEKQEVKAIAK
jgi:hypothetical protein